MANGFVAMVESDLKNLAAESRRAEPGFAGYFGGAQHPEIKDAAERALLKLRSLPTDTALGPSILASCEV